MAYLDLQIGGGGGGGWGLKEIVFQPFGPHFGLIKERLSSTRRYVV